MFFFPHPNVRTHLRLIFKRALSRLWGAASTRRPLSSRASASIFPTHASPAISSTSLPMLRRPWTRPRRQEQKTDPNLKGLRWALLKERDRLPAAQRADLDALIANVTTKRTARAWLYREQLREILDRKQINVVSAMLDQWCTNVMRSKVEPMKDVARMIRSISTASSLGPRHARPMASWKLSTACSKPPSVRRAAMQTSTKCTVIFLIAGKLDFASINPHAA